MAKFHTLYNRPPRSASPAGGVSLCDASCLKETDINLILRRYNAGDSSSVNHLGVFADVSALGDFATNMEVIRQATEDFNSLSSEVRQRFGNDPRALVAFLADSSNDDEAIRLGLKVRHFDEPSLVDQIVEGVTVATAKAASSAEG